MILVARNVDFSWKPELSYFNHFHVKVKKLRKF
jgi:hypothetical protein